MKRVNSGWRRQTLRSLSNRISMRFERWGRLISDRFQRWCKDVPPRRIKLYAILVCGVAVGCNIALIVKGVVSSDRPEFGSVSAPEHIKTESRPGEDAARRVVRSKMELTALIDSLEGDSMGRWILKKMTTVGRVKLDSVLLK